MINRWFLIFTFTLIAFYGKPPIAQADENLSCTINVSTNEQLNQANSAVVAGDVVCINSGIYGVGINPSNSGTQNNPIVYKGVNSPVFKGSSLDRFINISKDYIRVYGLTAEGVGGFGQISGNNNIISNINFKSEVLERWGGGFAVFGNNNTIRQSVFSNSGDYGIHPTRGDLEDAGDMITFRGDNNLFEDNELFNAGHTALVLNGNGGVIRGNYCHNFNWSERRDGKEPGKLYGTRCIAISEGGKNYLLEENRLSFAGNSIDQLINSGIKIAGPNNIVRYNLFYANTGSAIQLTSQEANPEDNIAANNHIYNNTFYKNGYSQRMQQLCGNSPQNSNLTMCRLWYKNSTAIFMRGVGSLQSQTKNNVVINNIFYKNNNLASGQSGSSVYLDNGIGSQVINNNLDKNTDPLFTNTAESTISYVPDPNTVYLPPSNLPDLSLKDQSPAIDSATHLTTATNSGPGTLLNVVDPYFFSSGFLVASADYIKIGNQNPVKILSIDYTNKKITLTEQRSWSTGDKIYLHSNSRNVVFYGEAPDMGAKEYGLQPNPTPTNPEISPTYTPTPTNSPTGEYNPKFDLDDNGLVNILDIIEVLKYLFK